MKELSTTIENDLSEDKNLDIETLTDALINKIAGLPDNLRKIYGIKAEIQNEAIVMDGKDMTITKEPGKVSISFIPVSKKLG